MLQTKEIDVLRTLAAQYMEYALAPHQKELEALWIAHNTGRPARPMVLIDQLPWHEMDVDGFLQCQIEDPYWRQVEQELRHKIYPAKYMPADMLLLPYILIPRILQDPKYRSFGVSVQENIATTDAGSDVVSHAYETQFQTFEDLEKLRPTRLAAEQQAEKAAMDEAVHVFEGIAPVHWQGVSLHSGLWDEISQWQGVEECYYMLLDDPDLLHAILSRITDNMLEMIRQGSEEGLFDTASTICHCSHTITAPFGSGMENRFGTARNSWTFGMAQLFTSVSPDVTREFELPYVSRIFEQFGGVYYGCCEKLDDRLDIVAQMPNVKKVSCSPWSDPDRFAANLPKQMILSHKPNPAFVSVGDLDASRRELERVIRAAGANGVRLEMILKDNSTVHYKPERLWEFSRMASELVQA